MFGHDPRIYLVALGEMALLLTAAMGKVVAGCGSRGDRSLLVAMRAVTKPYARCRQMVAFVAIVM